MCFLILVMMMFLFITKFGAFSFFGESQRRKGSCLVAGLVVLCLLGITFWVAGRFFESETARHAHNLYIFVKESTAWIAGQDFSLKKEGWDQEDEKNFVASEDPQRVRVLQNLMSIYEDVDEVAMETITLKVSRNRIRPGTKVAFEATPSPETPKLGSELLLYCDSLTKTLPLSRRSDGKYRGSLTFKETDAGEFRFFITTFPRMDKKARTMTVYVSNSVPVFVAPDAAGLSHIFFQEAQRNQSIPLEEGESTLPTLIAVGKNGQEYVITNPGIGTVYSMADESRAIVSDDGSIVGKTSGETLLTAFYGNLQAEAKIRVFSHEYLVSQIPRRLVPPPGHSSADGSPRYLVPEPPRPVPEIPHVINPPDGVVVQVGTKVLFEVSSFDTSKGHEFIWSSWSVGRVNLVTGGVIEVAYLRSGNSNVAEWIPRGTGTFEWGVKYFYAYNGGYKQRNGFTGEVLSLPQRILVVE